MRKLFAVIAGMFVAFAVLTAFDALDTALYPVPDLTSNDTAALAAVVAGLPLSAKLIVVISWLLAPLAGAWTALRILHWLPGGWIVTGLFLAANIANQVMLPHPTWMRILSVVLPLIGGWLGQRLHHKPYPGEPLLG